MTVAFLAQYMCMSCGHKWRVRTTEVTCPMQVCGSKYVEWINFKEVRDRGFKR